MPRQGCAQAFWGAERTWLTALFNAKRADLKRRRSCWTCHASAAPARGFHVAGVDARSKPSIISGTVPGLYLYDTEKDANGNDRYASFVIEADGSRLYIGSRSKDNASTPGSGSRAISITDAGYLGLGVRNPREKLEVNGNAYIDGDLIVTGEIVGADGQPRAGGGGAED